MSDSFAYFIIFSVFLFFLGYILFVPAKTNYLLAAKTNYYLKYARGDHSGGIGMVRSKNGGIQSSIGAGQCNYIMKQLEYTSRSDIESIALKGFVSKFTIIQIIFSFVYFFLI